MMLALPQVSAALWYWASREAGGGKERWVGLPGTQNALSDLGWGSPGRGPRATTGFCSAHAPGQGLWGDSGGGTSRYGLHLVGRAEFCQICSLERAVWGLVQEACWGGLEGLRLCKLG